MIRRSFSVFAGVGRATERAIRAAGVTDWRAFLDGGAGRALTPRRAERLLPQVEQWSAALDRRDARFFAERLARAEHWQLFDVFCDSARFLDIETTGLSPGRDRVTVVGIHGGGEFRALVRGQDLSADSLGDALEGCKLLVSYFGSVFDVPFLRRAYPELEWNMPHFDLCFAGRRADLRGGLKRVERLLGIERPPELVELDGFEAVRLWHRYRQTGERAALDKLIAYNRADTVNLERIAPIIYQRLCEKAGR